MKEKKIAKATKPTMIICWFKEDQWDDLKEIISDPENMGESYTHWREAAEKHINEFRRSGGVAHKMGVDAKTMFTWFKENNLEPTTPNLQHYAMHLFEEKSPTMLVSWFKEEQWSHLKKIIPDAETLGDSYNDWKEKTEKKIEKLRKKGQRIKKILIDTEQMQLWATQNNIELTTASLSTYATFLFSKNKKSNKKPSKYGNNFYQDV